MPILFYLVKLIYVNEYLEALTKNQIHYHFADFFLIHRWSPLVALDHSSLKYKLHKNMTKNIVVGCDMLFQNTLHRLVRWLARDPCSDLCFNCVQLQHVKIYGRILQVNHVDDATYCDHIDIII